MLTGRNHHSVGMGAITEMATSAPGNSSIRPKEKAPIAETLKLNGYSTAQFGKCHEVPAWEVTPVGAVSPMAHRLGFRILLRLRRRRGQPVLPRPVRRDHGRRAAEVARGGLHPHRGSREPCDHLGAPAEGADARQAVLHVLRPGRYPCTASRAEGMVGQVQGQVRRRLGRVAREDARAAEEAGRGAQGRGADQAARRDPGVGRHASGPQAGAGPADGDLRRLPRADRPRGRPACRRDRRPRHPRRHADLLHPRRQRCVGRGDPQRLLQRNDDAQRHAGHRDARVPAVQDRRFRHAQGLQPLRRGLGARAVRAVPVDQAGRLALGRHPQRHDRALAQRLKGQGQDPATSSTTSST